LKSRIDEVRKRLVSTTGYGKELLETEVDFFFGVMSTKSGDMTYQREKYSSEVYFKV